MAKNQSDYFQAKHPWSETKDDLLACYLTPFFTKVYRPSRNGILYIDAFAGAGLFADGSKGSPLTALSKYFAIAKKNRSKTPIQFILSESNAESRKHLESTFNEAKGASGYIKPPIIVSSCEDAIRRAQQTSVCGGGKPSTVFYYIDPFGVKDLRLDLLTNSPNMAHTEALVNFNSFGLFRVACAAMKVPLSLPNEVELPEDDFNELTKASVWVERLNACIGSGDWKEVVVRYKAGKIDAWQAEHALSELFCNNARSYYKYVTNMPIKDMSKRVNVGGLVKYRMIHMTNSPDGCVLMNDNMIKRNLDRQCKQLGLFAVDVDGRNVETAVIAAKASDFVQHMPVHQNMKMGDIAATLISECGVFDRSNTILKTYVGPMIEEGVLERAVKFTLKGKPKKSFALKDEVYRAR